MTDNFCTGCDYDGNCYIQRELEEDEKHMDVELLIVACRRGKYPHSRPIALRWRRMEEAE